MSPCINATISIIKKIQYDFPKMGGGSKAVSNFSKNASDLVAGSFPKSSTSVNGLLSYFLKVSCSDAMIDLFIFVIYLNQSSQLLDL